MPTATANRFHSLIGVIENNKHPYLFALGFIFAYSVIVLVNSLTRFHHLYKSIDATYIAKLCAGGFVALAITLVLRAAIFYLGGLSGHRRIPFGSFLMGITAMSVPSFLPPLLNIAYPIIKQAGKSTYTSLSIAAIVGGDIHSTPLLALAIFADVFEVVQVIVYSIYIHISLDIRVLYSVIMAVAIEYCFVLLAVARPS